ncbi:hypothetical protein pb186bvf_003163 [Paramecium bursaria]
MRWINQYYLSNQYSKSSSYQNKQKFFFKITSILINL